ncbi:MAG: hypothetical protein MHM6MM_003265 [Cercozoa sp. M6MM]
MTRVLAPLALAAISLVQAQLGDDRSLAEPGNPISRRMDVGNTAADFVDSVPRVFGPDKFDPENTEYIKNLVFYAALFIALAVVTLLLFVALSCLRSSCQACGGSQPSAHGYSKRARWGFFAALITLLSVTGIFSAIALAANDEVSNDVRGDDGLTSVAKNLLTDTINLLFNINTQADALLSHVDRTVTEVEVMMNDWNATSQQVEHFKNQTENLTQVAEDNKAVPNSGNMHNSSAPQDWRCILCEGVQYVAPKIAEYVDDAYKQVLNDTSGPRQSLVQNVVAARDEVNAQVGSFFDALNNSQSDLAQKEQDVHDVSDDVEKYDKMRHLAMGLMISIPLLAWFVAVIGGIIKNARLLHITKWLILISLLVTWIMLAVHLPIAVVNSDACVEMTHREDNLHEVFNDPDTERVITACLEDTPLKEVFNVSTAEYQQKLDTLAVQPTFNVSNATQQLRIVELLHSTDYYDSAKAAQLAVASGRDPNDPNDMKAFIEEGGLEEAAWNNTKLAQFVVEANALLFPQYAYYTAANVTNATTGAVVMNPLIEAPVVNQPTLNSDYMPHFVDWGNIRYAVRQVSQEATRETASLNALVATVDDKTEALMLLPQPLINAAESLFDMARCGFVGEAYLDTKTLLCEDTMSNFVHCFKKPNPVLPPPQPFPAGDAVDGVLCVGHR